MNPQLFITLPVADLPRALAFYEALGYSSNPQFSDGTAACITISGQIHVMLPTHSKFREFSTQEIRDTSEAIQVLRSLTCEGRAQVDDLVRKATAAGGSTIEPSQDDGFMCHHGFVDPDGHCWGLNHMSATPFA